MTSPYSKRAKKNHLNGINLRIGVIQIRIASIKEEIKLYKGFTHTKFTRKVLNTLKQKIKKREQQLDRYLKRKTKLKSTGQI